MKSKPTLESHYAPMTKSSSEKEESLLISMSIFYLYKEQKHSFKRLAIVTRLTIGVSNLLHVHFHRKVWFISVCQFSQRLRQMCVIEKLNFKISQGSMPLDPPSVLAPPVLDPLSAGSTLNCLHQSCIVMPKMVKSAKLKLIER